MEAEEKICALAFPDQDVLATAVLLDKEGKELACQFFRGGKRKEEQRRKILERIAISEESRGKRLKQQNQKTQISAHENAAWYAQLRKINKHYAHSISCQILYYCLENNIKVVVVPNYEDRIDFSNKRYLKTDAYRWLGRSIIKKLKYKAFAQGIVVSSVRPYHISDCCSECGEKIRKYNEGHTAGQKYYGGRLFVCPNGHKGNSAENTAKNVGKSFLSYYE